MAVQPEPEAVKLLARKHGVGPDFDMQRAMDSAYKLYTIISSAPRDQREQKDQLKKLAKKADRLDTAIGEFNDALNGFDELSQNPADKPLQLRRYEQGDLDKQRERVQQDAKDWGVNAEMASAEIGKLKPGGGDPAFNSLLGLLIEVYACGTGKEPTFPSTDPMRGRDTRGGPMFKFIQDCLDLLHIDKKTNAALGSAIDRRLNMRTP